MEWVEKGHTRNLCFSLPLENVPAPLSMANAGVERTGPDEAVLATAWSKTSNSFDHYSLIHKGIAHQ